MLSQSITRTVIPKRHDKPSTHRAHVLIVRAAQILGYAFLHTVRGLVKWTYHRSLGADPYTAGSMWGIELCSLLERLGPTFVKIGQILSSRPDLVDTAVAHSLTRLQDDVVHSSSSQIESSIERYLQSVGSSVFRSFDKNPVAAGSIAHVHKAVLTNGKTVAVKIRRSGAEKQIMRDLALFALIGKVADRLPILRDMPISSIIFDISEAIAQQIDFSKEIENNLKFQANFENHDRIRFPAIHKILCRDDVIVMEFMHDLRKINTEQIFETDRHAAAITGLRALYKMVFEDGFLHADMHPGNIFLRAYGEIVILDTGLVETLSTADKRDFTTFFFGLANNDGLACSKVIWDTAMARPHDDDWPKFLLDMERLVSSYARLSSQEFEITQFVYDLITLQRKHKILGSTKFIMTVLSMVVFDGICKSLYPSCDFQKEARAYIIYAKYRHINRTPAKVFI